MTDLPTGLSAMLHHTAKCIETACSPTTGQPTLAPLTSDRRALGRLVHNVAEALDAVCKVDDGESDIGSDEQAIARALQIDSKIAGYREVLQRIAAGTRNGRDDITPRALRKIANEGLIA